MDRREKFIVLCAGAGCVAALYEIDNPMLVTLLNHAFGDDTWGQYLGKRFGYVFDGEKWTINGVYNELANKLFTQEIRVTLDKKKVSIRNDYINQVTVGSLVASHRYFFKLFNGVNKYYKVGELRSDAKGIYVSGHFERLSRVVFGVKLMDVYRNRNSLKKYLVDTFGDVKLGDIGAGIAQKVLKIVGMDHRYSVSEDGVYTSYGSFINISEKFYNMTLLEARRSPYKKVKDIIKEANVGDIIADVANFASKRYVGKSYNGNAVLSSDKKSWIVTGDYDEFLNILYNLNVNDAFMGAKSGIKAYISRPDVFGEFRLGYIFAKGNNVYNEEGGYWENSKGTPIDFVGSEGVMRKTVYNLKVSDVITPEGFKFSKILDDLYVGEFIGYTCQDQDYGHEHTSDCVWYEETSAVVQGQEADGAKTLKVKLNTLNQTIAGLKFKTLLDDGFSLQAVFKGNKLGDVIGFEKVEENGEIVWYAPLETENGTPIVTYDGEFAQRVLEAQPVSTLSATLAEINASDLLKPNATETIINKVKVLKLGDVLEYVPVEENGATVWYKKNADGSYVAVDGVMAKLANHTVTEIENDADGIVKSWTIADILDAETIENSSILKQVSDVEIANINTAIEDVSVGVAMGYEKKEDGNWYNNKGLVVTDEIVLVLAEYKIGNLTGAIPMESGKTFSDDVVDNMLNKVTLGTIYPDAGNSEADGFMAILDPSWKLCDLSENLMNKLKTSTTVAQLIDLGVFGEYFDDAKNYELMDDIFKGAAIKAGKTSREYWTNLTMPEFMNGIMSTVTVYQQWFVDNRDALIANGITLPQVA